MISRYLYFNVSFMKKFCWWIFLFFFLFVGEWWVEFGEGFFGERIGCFYGVKGIVREDVLKL